MLTNPAARDAERHYWSLYDLNCLKASYAKTYAPRVVRYKGKGFSVSGRRDADLGPSLLWSLQVQKHPKLTAMSGAYGAAAAFIVFGPLVGDEAALLKGPRAMSGLNGQYEKAIMEEHAAAAAERFAVEGFTARQAAAIARNPGLTPMFRGERIDTFTKQAAMVDERLVSAGVRITPRFVAGPDFYNADAKMWWDITTSAQWPLHVAKYGGECGQGLQVAYP